MAADSQADAAVESNPNCALFLEDDAALDSALARSNLRGDARRIHPGRQRA